VEGHRGDRERRPCRHEDRGYATFPPPSPCSWPPGGSRQLTMPCRPATISPRPPSTGRTHRAGASPRTPGPRRIVRYGFVIDQRKCIGCHACTVACKEENQVPLGVNRTWVKYIEKGTFPDT